MANKKFSEFTVKTSTSDVDFVVGYDGTDNVRITPANLTGGGGASSLNGLTDCLVDTNSLYVGEVPSGLSGNPQANTILGIDAGKDLTTGNTNILVGGIAGQNITTGAGNVVVGYEAANNLTSGQDNVCVGKAAFRNTTIGFFNTAIGYDALRGGGNKNHNTAVGFGSGAGVTTGAENTLLGSLAGNTITTGANNLVVGYNAQATSVTATNEITLGNSSISTLRCSVQSITSLSDKRDKSEIKNLEYGLDFISSLKPREFVWNNRVETITTTDEEGKEIKEEFYSSNKGKKDFGFIAQEVKELDNDTLRLVYDENPEKLELSYGKLVPILVKAIQELKAEVDSLKKV